MKKDERVERVTEKEEEIEEGENMLPTFMEDGFWSFLSIFPNTV